MKKVAVFGNAGAGKSTLARKLAEKTSLPLHVLDMMQFHEGGAPVKHEDFVAAHEELIQQSEWVIDGFGTVPTAWARFAAADTLVYIDLPLPLHLWWITKRFLKGLFVAPAGWPKRSPLLKSTILSYRNAWLCHQKLTPRYRQLVAEEMRASNKKVFHLRSKDEIRMFLKEL